METIFIHATDPFLGAQIGKRKIGVHNQEQCAGQNCCIHNPSDHPLKDADLNWRSDRRIMERFCEHGIGHDDPDDVWFRVNILGEDPEYASIHGCDGCCKPGGLNGPARENPKTEG